MMIILKMLITKKLLIEKGATCAGVQTFVELFPDGLECEWTLDDQLWILGTPLRKHLGWAWYRGIVSMWGMSGANLTGAYLTGADLTGANLYGASLAGANLSRADLSGANLDGADLDGAYRRFNPPKGWKLDESGYLHKDK